MSTIWRQPDFTTEKSPEENFGLLLFINTLSVRLSLYLHCSIKILRLTLLTLLSEILVFYKCLQKVNGILKVNGTHNFLGVLTRALCPLTETGLR